MKLGTCATAIALAIGMGYAGLASAAGDKGAGAMKSKHSQAMQDCLVGPQGDARQQFSQLDANDDGSVGQQEIVACLEQAAGGGSLQPEQRAEVDKLFDQAGAAQDDRLSEDAYVQAVEQWQTTDASGSGQMTTGQASGAAATGGERDRSMTTGQAGTSGAAGTTGQTDRSMTTGQAGTTGTAGGAVTTGRSDVGTTGQAGTGTAIGDDVADVQGRAGDYIGKSVVNLNGDEIGDIDELVVDPATNRVHAVIGVGGFLGIGERNVSVPLSELQVGEDEAVLMTRETEDSLRDRPAFEGAEWQRITD